MDILVWMMTKFEWMLACRACVVPTMAEAGSVTFVYYALKLELHRIKALVSHHAMARWPSGLRRWNQVYNIPIQSERARVRISFLSHRFCISFFIGSHPLPLFCRGYDMVVWRWSACGRERVSQLQGHGSKELFWYCVAKCERLIS